MEAVKELATVAEEVPRAVTECKAVVSKLENLVYAIQTLKSPMSFVYHVGKDLVVNGVQIFHDVEDLML